MRYWINKCQICDGRWFEVYEDTNDSPGDKVHYFLKCTECGGIEAIEKTVIEEAEFQPE